GPGGTLAPVSKKTSRPCRSRPQPFDNLAETGRANQNEDTPMRFMLLVKANKDSEAGKMPGERILADMAKFNEEMIKAGVLLAGDGLQSSSKGARVRFSGGKRTVIDGPFAETKELIAGYWLIQVRSKEEAVEWVKRCPAPMEGEEGEIEIRQVFELTDFAPS